MVKIEMHVIFYINLASSMATGLMLLFAIRYHFYYQQKVQNLYIILVAATFLLWNASDFFRMFELPTFRLIFFYIFLVLASITPALQISSILNLKKLFWIESVFLIVFGGTFSLTYFIFPQETIATWEALFFTLNSAFVVWYLTSNYISTRSFSKRSKIAFNAIYYFAFSVFEMATIWTYVYSVSISSYLLISSSLILSTYLYILTASTYGKSPKISTGFLRNTLYGTLVSLVISTFFVIGFYINSYFSGRIGIVQSFFVNFALVLFAFLAFNEYFKKVDRLIERLTKSGSYYYRKSMMNFIRRILEMDTLEDLEPLVSNYCRKVLNTNNVEIFFKDDDGTFKSARRTLKKSEIREIPLSPNIVDLYTIQNKLSNFRGKELLIWIKNTDKIEGFMLLGYKRFGRYTVTDMEIVNIISNQLALFMSRLRSIRRVRKAERNMFFQEKMASLGRLAFGVAHEIRNPLNVISTSLQIINEDASSTEKLKGYIQEEINRINEILENFLDFARQRPQRSKLLDVREIVEKTALLLSENALKKTVEISVKIPDSPVMIKSDKNMLMEILLNLGTNALDAVKENESIEFSLTVDGKQLHIEVSDNGNVISSEEIRHIFEPFYTTKEHGTGLGLAIVYNYVQGMNGNVSVLSEKGKTIFTVTLPMEVDK